MLDDDIDIRLTDDTAQLLTEAILAQASKDYRAAAASFRRAPSIEAVIMLRDVEAFFRSRYFSAITSMDGKPLLERLRDEAGTRKWMCARDPALFDKLVTDIQQKREAKKKKPRKMKEVESA